jgi:pyruvate formate lyase activating enzyme
MKEAWFWEARDEGKVLCTLCWQRCVIEPGTRGFCGVRENRDGRLVSLNYGEPIARHIDPIEKKPLYHFLPHSRAYSVGARGCNFRCLHCQNSDISQVPPDALFGRREAVPPADLVREAARAGCESMAYTYTEPTIFYEYAWDMAEAARAEGLRNVFVTNGYTSPAALDHAAPLLDAANIDLKFMRDDLYREVCGARLAPVLQMIRRYRERDIWIELTTLLIPGYNDDDEQLAEFASFIADLDPAIPWHVSAFRPQYRMMDVPPTPMDSIERALAAGRRAGLHYVYPGNVARIPVTACPACGRVLVTRDGGPGGTLCDIRRGACPGCGAPIAGRWE